MTFLIFVCVTHKGVGGSYWGVMVTWKHEVATSTKRGRTVTYTMNTLVNNGVSKN